MIRPALVQEVDLFCCKGNPGSNPEEEGRAERLGKSLGLHRGGKGAERLGGTLGLNRGNPKMY
jgi:hypothetical protein